MKDKISEIRITSESDTKIYLSANRRIIIFNFFLPSSISPIPTCKINSQPGYTQIDEEKWLEIIFFSKFLHCALGQDLYTPLKEMAIHSSTIAWKIPRTEESGRLQSMGSQRVGHN